MDISTSNVTAEIRGWLQENVTGNRELPDDYPLIESGVLTSLQTVELVMFMEDRFDISVEDDELDEENFESIKSIAGLVTSKTA
ncbi:MAG: phosphopantetheine-binding protein [Rubrobacteraceae bacterium]